MEIEKCKMGRLAVAASEILHFSFSNTHYSFSQPKVVQRPNSNSSQSGYSPRDLLTRKVNAAKEFEVAEIVRFRGVTQDATNN